MSTPELVEPQAAPITQPPAQATVQDDIKFINARQPATTLDQWTKAKAHFITLLSGTTVLIEIPDLPDLIRTGELPNNLVTIAIGVVNGKKVTAEDISEQAAFYNQLVAMTVKQPSVTVEQIEQKLIPAEDKEMIVEFAVRQRDTDAVGHQIGGLETDASFRSFRGLLPLDAFDGGV